MTNAEVINSFKACKDKYGLIQPRPGEITGNGLLYSAEACIILNQLGLLSDEDKDAMKKTYDACRVDYGLYNRHPDDRGLNAQDDLIGVTALAHELGWVDITGEVLLRSKTPRALAPDVVFTNYFDNTKNSNFMPAAWLGRFPPVIAHLCFAAKSVPSFFYRLAFTLNLLTSIFKTPKPHAHDYWLLGWLMAYTARGQDWMCDLAIKVFFKQVEKHGGIGKICGEYFANPENPIAQNWSRVKV